MNALLSRFLLRLALPTVGLAALLALAEPLPAPAAPPMQAFGAELRSQASLVRLEADRVRAGSEEATAQARASAAAMRWLITLPAASASGRRCLVDTCGS